MFYNKALMMEQVDISDLKSDGLCRPSSNLGEGTIKCSICGRKFKNLISYQRHKSKNHNIGITFEEYTRFSISKQSNKAKWRLIKEGILEEKCAICNNTLWMGLRVPLELDHIDGVKENWSISNLRLLCPNCHAQTECYRGANTKKARQKKV